MNLSHLGLDELRQLGRWLDWAEHHAMLEHSICSAKLEYSDKMNWEREVSNLAQMQKDIRAEYERRTGAPAHSVSWA